MNTFFIILIVLAVLAVVFGILWCICLQTRSYSPPHFDAEKGLEDDTVIRRPVRNPRIGIRKKYALAVMEVLEKNVVIPKTTRRKHIFWGNSNQFTPEAAIKISIERGQVFLDDTTGRNTVFQEPVDCWRCNTNDPDYPEMVISRQPVEAYQCVNDSETGEWTALYLGKYHALFGRKSFVADHFVGYLYARVNFPE